MDESKKIKKWVNTLAEENFHSFTSKNEIMEMIQFKLGEQEVGSKVKKGHNGIPEFMSYDVISSTETIDAEPTTKPAPVKPKTNPGTKPKTPYQPGPGKNPKPKALKETK
jgi:type IV secretory pathway VirB10-like protein